MDKAEPLFVKFNQCSNLDSFKIKNKDIHYTYTNNFPKLDMVITQILKNKNIKFTLFFPPYSRLYYYEMNNEQLNKNISMRRYLLKKLNGSKNVNIFAFDNLFFTNDLFYYKDKAHYRAVINKKILVMISKNIGRLTLKNIDYYEQTFIKNLSNYSIYTSSTECKKYSKKNNLVANILNI